MSIPIRFRTIGGRVIRARSSEKKPNMKKDTYRDSTEYVPTNGSGSPVLSTGDVSDHITSILMLERWENCVDTFSESVKILATRKEWMRWSKLRFQDWRFYECSEDLGVIHNPQTRCIIWFNVRRDNLNVSIFGDHDDVQRISKELLSEFSELECYVEWVYNNDGHSVRVPITDERMPISEMYPFLNGETLEEYYDGFMESNSNVLLLIGPPGTGKTSFIRGLLQHCKTSAMVTYDSSILEKDFLFANFMESDSKLLVLEDSDNFLMSRSDGNTIMHKFLNVGDGLVSLKHKKMVFTTNLPNIKDVDSALLRPGRCFGVLQFSSLNKEQAEKASDALGLEFDGEKEEYNIADIFHTQSHKAVDKKMGFI